MVIRWRSNAGLPSIVRSLIAQHGCVSGSSSRRGALSPPLPGERCDERLSPSANETWWPESSFDEAQPDRRSYAGDQASGDELETESAAIVGYQDGVLRFENLPFRAGFSHGDVEP